MNKNIPVNLRESKFKSMWQKAQKPNEYTDESVLRISAAYLKVEVWVWWRANPKESVLHFAQRFTPYTTEPHPQIHLILDGKANSRKALDGHFTLMTSYCHYGAEGAAIIVNVDAPDNRMIELTLIPNTAPTTTLDQPQPKTTAPVQTKTKSLRARCSAVNCKSTACSAALQQKKMLCTQCLLLCNVCQINLACNGTTLCIACQDIAHGGGRDSDDGEADAGTVHGISGGVENRYAMAWTDGGRRDVNMTTQLSPRRKETKTLKNVSGWAFLLLCGRGQKYIASGCLGENSTNNIAELKRS